MKHLFKMVLVVAVIAASYLTFSAFTVKKKKTNSVAPYQIVLSTKNTVGSNTEWTWTVTNPNPGNGNNGTLQNVSHWDVTLPSQAEDALVSAQYSFDGV